MLPHRERLANLKISAVDRDEHVVGLAVLDATSDFALGVDVPAVRIAMANDQLVGRIVDTGELKVVLVHVVEDDVAVRFPAAGRFLDRDRCLDLEVGRHDRVDMVHGDRVTTEGLRGNFQPAIRCFERA